MFTSALSTVLVVQCVLGQELVPFYHKDQDLKWDLPQIEVELDELSERSFAYMCEFKNDFGSGHCVSVSPPTPFPTPFPTPYWPIGPDYLDINPGIPQIDPSPILPPPLPLPIPPPSPNYYTPPVYPPRVSLPALLPAASVIPFPNALYTLPLSSDSQFAARFFVDDFGGSASSLLNSLSSLPLVDALGGRHLF